MKRAHSVHIRVFAKEGEDIAKIKEGLSFMVPFDYEKEKIKVDETNAIGFSDKQIKIFEITLSKERHINAWLNLLVNSLKKEQKDMLLRQIDTRIDDECCFFIRFDKDKIFDKEFFITDSGSCYHVRISLAAYPKTRENSKKIVEEMLK